jgi:hypothetical protein
MCPGVLLTVELSDHAAVLAIIRRPALAIPNSFACILTSRLLSEQQGAFGNRTQLISSMFQMLRNFLARIRPAALTCPSSILNRKTHMQFRGNVESITGSGTGSGAGG